MGFFLRSLCFWSGKNVLLEKNSCSPLLAGKVSDSVLAGRIEQIFFFPAAGWLLLPVWTVGHRGGPVTRCQFPQAFSAQMISTCSDRVARYNTSCLQLYERKHFSLNVPLASSLEKKSSLSLPTGSPLGLNSSAREELERVKRDLSWREFRLPDTRTSKLKPGLSYSERWSHDGPVASLLAILTEPNTSHTN